MSELLAAALDYAAHGFRVFPCRPGEKQPIGGLVPHGVKDATSDASKIIGWWTSEPRANIGLATGGGRWVLDLDDSTARERLEAQGVELPPAPAATTGNGAHLWFAGDIKNRTKVIEKVDTRGEGGYVVAPPSLHPNGTKYAWVDAPPFGPLPQAPARLLQLLGGEVVAAVRQGLPDITPGSSWPEVLIAGVSKGGRDEACTRLAGYFLGKGIPASVTEAVMQKWARDCDPIFPESEVEKCVRSIAAREGDIPPDTAPPSLRDLMQDTLDEIYRPVRNARATGFDALDRILEGGFEPGTTTLVGGRPGTGKTVVMLQVARHVAESGQGVLFFTLEMSGTRLLRRLLVQKSQVRFENVRSGNLSGGERNALTLAAADLAGLPFYIETRAKTVEAIADVVDTYAAGSIGLVVVDYLQKLRAPERAMESRQRVEHVSDALTKLAVSRNIPLVVASSLSRPDRSRPTWRPTMASLRESGQLEHDADNILLLFREEERADAPLEIHVGKQRDGATGDVTLEYDGPHLTFREPGAEARRILNAIGLGPSMGGGNNT